MVVARFEHLGGIIWDDGSESATSVFVADGRAQLWPIVVLVVAVVVVVVVVSLGR